MCSGCRGIDLKAGGRNKRVHRDAPKSNNPYLKLLVKVLAAGGPRGRAAAAESREGAVQRRSKEEAQQRALNEKKLSPAGADPLSQRAGGPRRHPPAYVWAPAGHGLTAGLGLAAPPCLALLSGERRACKEREGVTRAAPASLPSRPQLYRFLVRRTDSDFNKVGGAWRDARWGAGPLRLRTDG